MIQSAFEANSSLLINITTVAQLGQTGVLLMRESIPYSAIYWLPNLEHLSRRRAR